MLLSFFLIISAVSCFFAGAKPCLHATEEPVPPKLELPWGTWEAKLYGPEKDYWFFSNVRFGKAPVDKLRFAAPQSPDAISDPKKIQDSSFGPNCISANATKNFDATPFPNATQSEDCLFLDIYVPDWAFELEEPSLPVVVWLYGGAYIFGGKNTTVQLPAGPFSIYDGAGIRARALANLIWVVPNYRMGAYGFLAGQTMEQAADAAPNAGLLDQQLAFEWVQKYIGLVKGDKEEVSVWGLSAGAGSIMHHLTAYDGTFKDGVSLFKRAVLWSTAFQWSYDRTGTLEDTFMKFTQSASCPRDSKTALDCLRKLPKDSNALRLANQKVVSDGVAQGLFPFGPAIDGKFIKDLPAAQLARGKHVKVESLILSHDYDEAGLFVAKWIQTPQNFTTFLNLAFPGNVMKSIRDDIEKKYPTPTPDPKDPEDPKELQQWRTTDLLRDSTFVCNAYQIFKAYNANKTSVYTSSYSMPPATHGIDLLPLIWNEDLDITEYFKRTIPGQLDDVIIDFLSSIWAYFARSYQLYFAGHAVTGDPNYLTTRISQRWFPAQEDEGGLENVLRLGFTSSLQHPFFSSGYDTQVSATNCDFWTDVALRISKLKTKEAEADTRTHEYSVLSELEEILPELLTQYAEL